MNRAKEGRLMEELVRMVKDGMGGEGRGGTRDERKGYIERRLPLRVCTQAG